MSGGVHSSGSRAFDVVVIAASYGGPAAVGEVCAALPADFPATVLVVQHRPPTIDTFLATALGRRAALPVTLARGGQRVGDSGILVVPARHSGTIGVDGLLDLVPSASHRLADPLMASVAQRHGPRALGVVLTGRLDDGAAGVRALKRAGGRSVVQEPATAVAGDMPSAALATGCVDLVMPLDRIAATLVALTMAPGAADLFRVPPSPWATVAA
ncbi:chemotaxis protein CheB [Actinoplanes sp. CA-030573]|uniref:chemotaxis protein CheB n=1 Tax=Actinoplanes sp. CA-030573 TaxID=3239898 RepID=UPI003D9179FC